MNRSSEEVNFFGHPDAAGDRLSFSGFQPVEAYERAKKGALGDKLFIVGVLGSGKTAVRQRIRDESSQEQALVWELGELTLPEQALDFDELRKDSPAIAYVTVNWILWEIARRVLSDSTFTPAQVKKLKSFLPSLAQRFKEYVRKTASGVKVKGSSKGPEVELDLGRVLADKGGPFARNLPLGEWRDALTPCLKVKPVYVLWDEVEQVFPGLKTSIEALDGVLYGCDLLNEHLGPSLTFLVFLQWTSFLRLKRQSLRYEKLTPRMERLKWTPEQLRSMLAMRVKERKNLPAEMKDDVALKTVFDAKDKQRLDALLGEVVHLSVNGPRDLIALCNMAYARAGGKKITRSHLAEIRGEYGDDKLDGIEREFGHQSPNIARFIERFFTEGPSEYTPVTLDEHVSAVLPEARETFPKEDWLKASTRQIVEVLYEVGFIGFRRKATSKEAVYVITEPVAHRQPWFHACQRFEVHPAFRGTLGLKPKSASSKAQSRSSTRKKRDDGRKLGGRRS